MTLPLPPQTRFGTAVEKILTAGGLSPLATYRPATQDKMRDAMRVIMQSEYSAGVRDATDVARSKIKHVLEGL